MGDITITDNPGAQRFELRVAGGVAAYLEYNLLEGVVTFTHTEVLPEHESQGFGSKLARFALDHVRRRGLRAVPVCEFIAGFISRHDEYQELVNMRASLKKRK